MQTRDKILTIIQTKPNKLTGTLTGQFLPLIPHNIGLLLRIIHLHHDNKQILLLHHDTLLSILETIQYRSTIQNQKSNILWKIYIILLCLFVG